jgi:hypothetical protein
VQLKTYLGDKYSNLQLHRLDLKTAAADSFRDFQGQVFYLASAESHAELASLGSELRAAGLRAEQVNAIAYQDSTSGTLGVSLRDLKGDTLKEQLPDYFKRDAKGRYTVDRSAAQPWETRYQSTLTVAFATARSA